MSHVHATDKANTQDHPLLERYPNSVITDFKTLDYNQAKLAIKPFSDSDGGLVADNFINVGGKITYIAYDLPDGLSGYQVFENYLSALSNKATELLYICRKEDACFESSYMNSVNKITDNLSSYSCIRKFNLVAKTKIAESQFAYINLCVSQHQVTQVIIEEKAFTPNKIKQNTHYAPNEQSLSGVSQQPSEDKANTQDHPLLERYPNSVITDFKTLDYNQAKLAIKPFSDSDGGLVADNFINVGGKITYIAYDLPDGLSGYQVFENYLSALSNKATELLYICRKEDACDESSYMNSGNVITDNLSPYLCINEFNLVAKTKIAESQFAYINLCVSQHRVEQVIIEEKAFTKDLISLSANEMAQGLSKQGKVAIYGIHFESNSDIILNTSVAAFEQLASLFAMRAELNLYVVGHTDSQGDEEYNQALSTKRAQAVINKLVQSYGVAKERLQARGVGELVPVSTNRDEEGRQLNRRVELVEM